MADRQEPAANDASRGISIVPRPVSLEVTGEGCVLRQPVPVSAGDDVATAKALLAEFVRIEAGSEASSGPGITITLDQELGAEAYVLVSDVSGVTISGGDAAGAFYGAQTLLQLLPSSVLTPEGAPESLPVPGVRISDRPAFGWRGAMLDVCRHFMPLAFVKRYIDLLAMHKLNTLHLHLTEDQGWRIEIDRYPKLTEVGSQRAETILGRPNRWHPENERFDRIPHGGFYTKDEIRELLDYARTRHVRIVPEVEVPGHAQAAIASYPELGNLDEALPVFTKWGENPHVLNVEESTVEFFRNVFDEVFELFDSPYVHLGGDECPKIEWQASPRAQELMRERGLKNEDELQSWFILQIAEHFAKRGRIPVGWDEIVEGGLASNAVVMSWRGESGGIAAARAGHDVVMAPYSHTYFDYGQTENADRELFNIGGLIPLETVYAYRPVPAELTADEAKHILGAQYQIWTEYMPNPAHVEYMAFPRACAFAETVWHPEAGDYDEFLCRMRTHAERLSGRAVQYRPLPFEDDWERPAFQPPVVEVSEITIRQAKIGSPAHSAS